MDSDEKDGRGSLAAASVDNPESTGTLVESEGVNAASSQATDEAEAGTAEGDVESGGDPEGAPPARGDGVSDQEPGLLGSSESDGQDSGSME